VKLRAEPRPEDMPPFWLDTREPPDPHPWGPHRRFNRVERVCLPFGDGTMAGFERELIFERKAKSDLVACVGRERDRFEKCVTGLLGYRYPYLVIESNWHELERQSWLGSLFSWEARGLRLIRADDADRAGTIMSRICFMHFRRAWKQARELFGNASADDAQEEATA
jgi:ERCC4-type nuclease